MHKIIRFVVLSPFRILSVPVMVVLFDAEWIGIFIESLSACIFNLVATFIFIIGIVAHIMGGASGQQWLEMMGLSFGFFIILFIGEGVVFPMHEVRYRVIELFW